MVDRLVETLRHVRQRGDVDVLTPTVLILPNRQVDTFLKFTIARQTGIAANLRTLFLRNFIETLLPQEPAPTQLLDRQMLQGLILRVLARDDLSQNAELRPVWEYLTAAGQRQDDVDLRRFQLSAQLARLFQEYDLTRPDMLQAWRQAKTLHHGAHAAMETWQRAIWLMLFGPDGERDQLARTTSVKRISASELGCATEFDVAAVPTHVHLFGLSYVARTYHRLFARLAQQTELHLYALSPWQVDLAPDEIAPMLQLWGRPGSENIQLLRNVGIDHVIADEWAPTQTADTALHRLQQAVLTGSMPPAGESEAEADDPSWRVLVCPSVRREVEIIANEIWELVMEADATDRSMEAAERLRFHDIAVMVNAPDQEMYQTHIAAVFKECYDIPLTMIDVPVAAQSGFVEAVGWLLNLPFSSFNRQEVLQLLTHPAFLSRLPEVDAEEWLTWCQQLAIVHGADRDAHAETYIRRDLFNWEQGSRRLLLGTFMSGSRSGEKRVFELGDTAYLPQEFPQDRLGNAASFALIVRSLIADARFCQTTQLSLTDWAGFLSHLLTAYLAAPVESDEPYVSQCLQLVQELEQLDCDGEPVSYRMAYEFVNAALEGIESRQGDYLSGGVVVSSLQPMRSIPFRAVFVVGMGEGKFPSADRDDPLDIRQAQRRSGDVSRREQDLYMFLETLISTRQRLCLSYVGRDEQTGETLQPSSVIQELLAFTGAGMMAPETVSQRVIHHPLARYDRRYFSELFPHHDHGLTNVLPAARNEAQIVALRDDLQQFCRTHSRAFPSLGELQTELDPEQWDRLQDRLGLVAVPDGLVGGNGLPLSGVSGPTLSVSLSSLRQFLYCPLQAWARLHLGLRPEGDDDWFDCEDEPFDTSRWVASLLLRDTFLEKWGRDIRDGGDVPFDHIYDTQAAYEELAGRLPTGLFLEAERAKHLRLLAQWQANLHRGSLDGLGELKVVRLGRAEEHAAVDEWLNPIVVEVDFPGANRSEPSMQVELHGRTEAISQSLPGSLTLIAGQRPSERDVLRGFFDQVVMSATEGVPEAPYHGIVNATEAIQTTTFEPISAVEATAYLHNLVGDFLGHSHAYLMPAEAVLQYRNPRSKRSLAQIIGALCDNPRASMSSRYGPVPFPERYTPPSEAEAERMIERRFGLFFDKQMTR